MPSIPLPLRVRIHIHYYENWRSSFRVKAKLRTGVLKCILLLLIMCMCLDLVVGSCTCVGALGGQKHRISLELASQVVINCSTVDTELRVLDTELRSTRAASAL